MNFKFFNKCVAKIVLMSFTLMTLIQPMQATAATSITIAGDSGIYSHWATHAANSNNWITMPNSKGFGNMINYFPKDDFTKIGQMQWLPDPESPGKSTMRLTMLDADKWIRYGREDVGALGVPSNLISERINQFPKTSAYVFASYSPENAELVVEVQKIEKSPDGILSVYRGDFTPWHGEFNKWRRDYLTPSEAYNPAQMGYNPFEKFKGASKTDNVFHNISWEAAGVAIGEAMKRYDSHIGYIASDKTRFTTNTKKSGGLLRKKVTTTIDGFAKPQWFVAMPLGHQPNGGMSSICVTSIGATNTYGNTTQCDAPEHVAISGVSIESWEGGSMPEGEDNVYHFVQSKSGFTVLAFAIFNFALTWGVASALSGAIGGLAGGIAPATVGAIGSGVYVGMAALDGAGLTTVQSSFLGSTGDGVLNVNVGAMNQHQQRLLKAVHNKQIASRVGTGLSSVVTLYSGNCNESWTVSQCQAAHLNPGTMHRPDSYAETNDALILSSQKAYCESQVTPADKATALTDPIFREQLRKLVQQCAAPQGGTWATGY